MESKQLYLAIIWFINLINSSSGSFLYGEAAGTFENSFHLSARIYFKRSNGIFLYAIDSNRNQLLMKIQSTSDHQMLVLNFNGQIRLMTIEKEQDSMKMFRIALEFKHNNLYEIINNRNISQMELLLSNVFSFDRSDSDLFDGYPIPKNYQTYTNKIFIWIGNIGPYNGSNNVVFQPITDQLIGCLYLLRISNVRVPLSTDEDELYVRVPLTTHGEDFSSTCSKYYNDTICKIGKCIKEEKRIHILDCSLESVNVKNYCFKDLSTFTNQKISYLVNSRNKDIYNVKLVWKQLFTKNNCLMEIHYWNESSVSFLTNKLNEIIMCKRWHRLKECSIKILGKISLNSTYALLLNFKYPDTIVRISDGDNVTTFYQPFPEYPTHVNIGFMEYANESYDFEGNIGFLYDQSAFKFWKKAEKDEKSNYQFTPWLIVPVIILIVFICIVGICIKAWKRPRQRVERINIYEMFDANNDAPQLPERNQTFINTKI